VNDLFAMNGPYSVLLLKLTKFALVWLVVIFPVLIFGEDRTTSVILLLPSLLLFIWFIVYFQRNRAGLVADWQQQRRDRAGKEWLAKEERKKANALEQEQDLVRQREQNRQREHLYSISDMLNASSKEFEYMVGRILERRGYNLIVVGGAGDEGVDLRGTGPNGEVVIVQCKRQIQSSRIQPSVIRDLIGTVNSEGADLGIFATTTFFGEHAERAAAKARVRLCLLNGSDLTILAGSSYRRFRL